MLTTVVPTLIRKQVLPCSQCMMAMAVSLEKDQIVYIYLVNLHEDLYLFNCHSNESRKD